MSNPPNRYSPVLSAREERVLRMVCSGMTYRRVGETFGLASPERIRQIFMKGARKIKAAAGELPPTWWSSHSSRKEFLADVSMMLADYVRAGYPLPSAQEED